MTWRLHLRQHSQWESLMSNGYLQQVVAQWMEVYQMVAGALSKKVVLGEPWGMKQVIALYVSIGCQGTH